MSTVAKKMKQPKVLYLAFIVSMSERFGFYIMNFLLTLYVKAIYNLSDGKAFALYAMFVALGYLTPVIGGYLADNTIGIRRCLGLGLLLEASGYFLLSVPTGNRLIFYLALGAIIVGAGIFKTAPPNLLGRAYDDGDPRIDSGFTLYYMGINVGSFSSSLIAGPISHLYGWHVPFFIGGIGLVLGGIWLIIFKHYGKHLESNAGNKKLSIFKWFIVVICSLGGIAVCGFLMSNLSFANEVFYIGCAVVVVYLIYQILISPKEDKTKIIVCLILISMAVAFYALYFQLYESMILFIQRNVNRNILGIIKVPAATFPGFNGLAILILSPILAGIYNKLERHKKDLSITTKFPLGIMIISCSFFLLKISTFFAYGDARISSFWIIAALFLYSLGELLTSALGLAMITRIAPARLYGIMMGCWYLIAWSLAANLSGNVAQMASIPKYLQSNLHVCLNIYGNAFFKMGLLGVAVAIIGFIIAPWLKKAAKI